MRDSRAACASTQGNDGFDGSVPEGGRQLLNRLDEVWIIRDRDEEPVTLLRRRGTKSLGENKLMMAMCDTMFSVCGGQTDIDLRAFDVGHALSHDVDRMMNNLDT